MDALALKDIQPATDCHCAACQALRVHAENARAARVLASWPPATFPRDSRDGSTLYFGKAAK